MENLNKVIHLDIKKTPYICNNCGKEINIYMHNLNHEKAYIKGLGKSGLGEMCSCGSLYWIFNKRFMKWCYGFYKNNPKLRISYSK